MLVLLAFSLRDTPPVMYLTNKYSSISTINEDKISSKYGELFYYDQILKPRFLWTTKTKEYSDIKRIMAYETVDFGLENHFKHLEIHFKDKDILCLNANDKSHQKLVDRILKDLNRQVVNWENELAPLGDKEKRDILYE